MRTWSCVVIIVLAVIAVAGGVTYLVCNSSEFNHPDTDGPTFYLGKVTQVGGLLTEADGGLISRTQVYYEVSTDEGVVVVFRKKNAMTDPVVGHHLYKGTRKGWSGTWYWFLPEKG